jgi:hypothetical protein
LPKLSRLKLGRTLEGIMALFRPACVYCGVFEPSRVPTYSADSGSHADSTLHDKQFESSLVLYRKLLFA